MNIRRTGDSPPVVCADEMDLRVAEMEAQAGSGAIVVTTARHNAAQVKP